MSNPYPSRRELRLQRERAERARLREAELKRWTDEVEQRDQPPLEPLSPLPVPDQTDGADDGADQPSEPVPDQMPPEVEADQTASEPLPSRRYRRAVSPVTSTGMLPIISKPSEQSKEPKPRSRREARQQASRRAAQRRAEIARLEREQERQGEELKPRRRATAPQTTPPPAPATVDPVENLDDELADVEITSTHELSATEITDMGGLDTIEIRRAELRAETERLTQEIIELGESNPNVIDPKLLRRQKELAEKSQELQDLETAAIELVESEAIEAPPEETDPAAADEVEQEPATDALTAPDDVETAEPKTESAAPQTTQQSSADAAEQQAEDQPVVRSRRRSRRRTTQGPFVSGPFEITEDTAAPAAEEPAAEKTKKPPLAEFVRAPVEPEPERDPREPLEASAAHGLDTLDARDVEAPDRRLRMSAVVMFAIGLIALIIAIILLV